ncbi:MULTISPECIES: glycosyltransferase family 2 protein [Stenotrophomonas]|uniref:Glycosyltransferase family 2 protein n=1 Tax=Stenotrophomonas maltophilia TaxID=40324 RepID=A0A2J0SSA6_STEMA|nr:MULTISPECIES: glycosyltransferase family 2 protein [Stenotrophomonas]MBA0309587.1 glycosyltransferase family 2 protein [Stenotrophomonas maltophilia]MBH1409482.1 glycosyltransferase family 2 protein [Stenotrophomonas maltophilia]MBH1746046.1 glycosyltransferase family 2 protein [Stenotrophomonas maltophilia]MDH1387923.1 glycosyltransferase family 2 protein [Stenotrophomonas sp. GD03701]MDH1393920.1 glycosyltransferase family 2 protein [Stenotrophomonas sp. GD03702]
MSRHLVFIPAYNCARQIARVLRQFESLPTGFVDRVLVIDNRSTDETLQVACDAARQFTSCEIQVCRNVENYGLGGSQKVGFAHALENGFERVTILHGDDQGSIADLVPVLSGDSVNLDALLGARFMPGSTLPGYSAFRTFGNEVFNLLFSLVARKRLHDLGSGLNSYRTAIFRGGFHLRFPDDLTFNYCMVLAHSHLRHSMTFFPITWREDDQISNVRLFRQASKVLALLGAFALRPRAFLSRDHRQRVTADYRTEVIYQSRTGA